MTNFINSTAVELLINACQKRQVCIGDGEVSVELYHGSTFVGEMHVSNGTRYNEESGEVHQYRLNYQSIDELPDEQPEWVCPCCGFQINAFDAIYWAEYPNSASMHLGQLTAEHKAEHENEEVIETFIKWKLKKLSDKGKTSILNRWTILHNNPNMSIEHSIMLDAFENGILVDVPYNGIWYTELNIKL